MKNITTIVFLLTSIHLSCLAQSTVPEWKKIIPPSPDVANLGVYGETPVSLYSGTPNINIPIYEITCGNLKLPISISYSAKGIKVEEIASSVGLGWSLNAGGIITRTILGRPDEIGYMSPANRTVRQLLQSWPRLHWGGLVTIPLPWPDNFVSDLRDIVNGNIDTEADIFYYNFGNYTGKFFYDQDKGQLVSVPQNNIYFDKQYFLLHRKWRLVTPDGVNYYFETPETNNNKSQCDGIPSLDRLTVTGWYLTRIEDPSTTTAISFYYEAYEYDSENIASHTINTSDVGNIRDCVRPRQTCTSNNHYSTFRLTSITYRGGHVDFISNTQRCDLPGTKALDRIKVYADRPEPFMSYKFNYGYFNKNLLGSCTENDRYLTRLKLNSLIKVSEDGREQPPHEFLYNQTRPLPSRMSYSQDAWGYYNNAQNDHLVPSLKQSAFDLQGANRTVDTVYTGIGTLRKVVYPTGGSTTYEFENHKVPYWIKYSTNRWIKRRTEDIGPAENGSGKPVLSDRLVIVDKRQNHALVDVQIFNAACYNCSARPLPPLNDCSILSLGREGSAKVTRLSCSQNDIRVENGIYRLTADFSGAPNPTYYEGFSMVLRWEEYAPPDGASQESSIGGLRIKKIVDDDGFGNEIVREYSYREGYFSGSQFEFEYRMGCSKTVNGEIPGDGMDRIFTVRQSYSNIPLGGGGSNGTFGYETVTESRTSKAGPAGKSVFTYSNANLFPDYVIYRYPYGEPISFDHRRGLLLKQEDYSWHDNTFRLVRSVQNKYHPLANNSHDWKSLSINNTDPLYSETLNVRAAYLDMWSGPPGSGNAYPYPLVYKNLTEWLRQSQTVERIYDPTGAAYVERETLYEYENPSHQQATKITTNRSDGSQQVLRLRYPLDYDPGSSIAMGIKGLRDKRHVAELVEKIATEKAGDIEKVTSATLVSYNSLQLPTTVYLAKIDKPIPWKDFKPSIFSSGTFVRDPSYEDRLSLTYETSGGKLVQQKKASNIATSYLWGYSNTLPVAEIVNATPTQVFHTSFEEDGTIGNSATGERYYKGTNYSIPTARRPTGSNLMMTYWYYDGHWKLREEIPYSTTISETNASGYDEIRIYPSNARMTTYCYKPGIGMISMTDTNNRITHYERDGLGRLVVIRDMSKKVVKTFSYHFKNE